MDEDNIAKLKGTREDYKKTFNSEEGKRVLADLARVCLYNSSAFNKEPMIMAFQEGLRGVYLHIKTILELDIDELIRINKKLEGGANAD